MWAWAGLAGCHGGSSSDVRPFPETDVETADTDTAATGAPTLALLTRFPLPFAEVLDPAPSADMLIPTSGEGSGSLRIQVEGPFRVTPDETTVTAGEALSLNVSADVEMDSPSLSTGVAVFALDDAEIGRVELAAVVGDAGLGAADWEADEYGLRAVVDLPSAPYPDGSGTWDDPSVLLFVPLGLSDRDGVDVVTHLHGHNATIPDTVDAQYLTEQHALSGRDALFVAPQGPVEYPSGDFGKLMERDGYLHLVRDAISVLYRDGLVTWPEIGEQALTSHSGGYLATAAIVDRGGLPISAVHLYDSLYGEADVYESFVLDGGVLRSVWTSGGGTDDNNRAFAADLAAEGVDVGSTFGDDELAAGEVTIGGTWSSHGTCMIVERNAARWLAASGLPRRPNAAPELLYTLADGRVGWRPDLAPGTRTWRVEGSDDSVHFETLAEVSGTTATVEPRAWLRLRVVEGGVVSDPSDTYGASGTEWLVVDGFDRVLGGSYTAPTHDFAARLGDALGAGFSVASNEAVARGDVDLGDFPHVLWMLGDESSYDLPFSDAEEAALAAYIGAGGEVIVTGSEAAYADTAFVKDTLHATFLADDAGTDRAGGYRFGVAYPEDYPDVIGGQKTVWTYDTGGAAAVMWDDRVIVVGFPLETLSPSDLAPAMSELEAALR